jgi:[ribosomal protein S5]-alanine N-acetyltransferase
MLLETPRLRLRDLDDGDAGFILRLLNERGFLRFIGDRGVRNLDDARRYIASGPRASYERHGFGLWLVERKQDGVALGICGLLKRDVLEDVDIGFAFLEEFAGQGYACEAARQTVETARSQFGLDRLVAITHPDNRRSLRLLDRLDFRFERKVALPGEDEELYLLGRDAAAA